MCTQPWILLTNSNTHIACDNVLDSYQQHKIMIITVMLFWISECFDQTVYISERSLSHSDADEKLIHEFPVMMELPCNSAPPWAIQNRSWRDSPDIGSVLFHYSPTSQVSFVWYLTQRWETWFRMHSESKGFSRQESSCPWKSAIIMRQMTTHHGSAKSWWQESVVFSHITHQRDPPLARCEAGEITRCVK